MYRLALLIFCFTATGCTIKFVTGTYITKGTPEVLTLKDDNTFTYSYLLDGSDLSKVSKGKWAFNGSVIILNSEFKKNEYPINVIEDKDGESHSYSFQFDTIYTRDKGNNVWQELLINDSFHVAINNKLTRVSYGELIHTFKIINYYVNYLNTDNSFDKSDVKVLETKTYSVLNNKSNFFRVFYKPFNSSVFHYLFFVNDSFKIKRNSLLWQQQERVLVYDTK